MEPISTYISMEPSSPSETSAQCNTCGCSVAEKRANILLLFTQTCTNCDRLQAGGPAFAMPTGRRDGRVSKASAVNLPGPTLSVADATKAFTAKGMTQAEMVTLLGT